MFSAHLLWRSENTLSNIYLITVKLFSDCKASIHRHILALKNARLCSLHFNSQQVHTILAMWPMFYKCSELSFTSLHIQNLNMLKQNSTHEVLKNERGKEDIAKAVKHEAWLSTVYDPTLICSGGTVSPIRVSEEKSVSPWQYHLSIAISRGRRYLYYNRVQGKQNQSFDGKCRHLVHFFLQHF